VHGNNLCHGNSELRLICHNFCVFSIVLSLALATTAPAQPAASVTSNAAIAVCFSPEEDCAAFAVRAIDNAESEILLTPHHSAGARSEPAHVSFFGPNGSMPRGQRWNFAWNATAPFLR
jgi:hypothetical protein